MATVPAHLTRPTRSALRSTPSGNTCTVSLRLNTCRYRSSESILQRGLDRQTLPEQQRLDLPAAHDHLRGPGYFH